MTEDEAKSFKKVRLSTIFVQLFELSGSKTISFTRSLRLRLFY